MVKFAIYLVNWVPIYIIYTYLNMHVNGVCVCVCVLVVACVYGFALTLICIL